MKAPKTTRAANSRAGSSLLALALATGVVCSARASGAGPQTASPPPEEDPRDKDHHSHPTTHEPAKATPGPVKPDPSAGAGEKVVEQGIFPKSIQIPGTDLSFSLGGYAKVDVIQDFDAIGDATQFKTNSIPAEGTAAAAEGGRTTIQAIETRFNVDLRSKERFRAFVEGDFYGSAGSFRLRHAYGEFHGLLGGQTWSTFQDITARPLTLDFEGPDGEVFVRQAMVRYTHGLSPDWKLALAVENPSPQFAVPSGLVGSVKSNAPDFVTSVRYQKKRGHFQAATLLRKIRFAGGPEVADESDTGWGMNLSFAVKTVGTDQLLAQYVVGDAVSRYVESLSGQNVDAVLSATGDLTTLRGQALVVGYIHNWTKTLRSGVAYSWADVDGASLLEGSAIASTQDFRANLILKPYKLVEIGAEALWGRRENQDGSRGDAWRGQFSVIYHFN